MRAWLASTAGATVIAAVITGIVGVLVTQQTILAKLPLPPQFQSVVVSAKDHPFKSTGIIIDKGDEVEIAVEDQDATWNCNTGDTGPEGLRLKRGTSARLSSANSCELVGSLQPDVYFRVGPYYRFTASQPGTLVLGANDAVDLVNCKPDCYTDNNGSLTVTVIVRKSKT